MNPSLPLSPLADWLPGLEGPLIIAGPCSAETEAQVLATAHGLAATGRVHVMRAGVWKPRTRPNAFEGIGEPALAWLAKAKAETGLPITVEVATAAHVEMSLKAGVDILWIGARTTVNPFSVQEVADALRGVDIPVLVKNPVNPDLELWIGALERVSQAGIKRLGAIHRGFSTYEKKQYRNDPKWKIPIELKRLLPELPILTDPSHIGGKRALIADLSQRALDLDFQGLIIESHIDPEHAWTDAAQQVTPTALGEILACLNVRQVEEGPLDHARLEALRRQIDRLDAELIETLADRMGVVEQIAECKRRSNMAVLQLNRWNEILIERKALAEKLGLRGGFMDELFELVHTEAVNLQWKQLRSQTANTGQATVS